MQQKTNQHKKIAQRAIKVSLQAPHPLIDYIDVRAERCAQDRINQNQKRFFHLVLAISDVCSITVFLSAKLHGFILFIFHLISLSVPIFRTT